MRMKQRERVSSIPISGDTIVDELSQLHHLATRGICCAAMRHRLRGYLAILAAPKPEGENWMSGYSARKRAKCSTKGAKLHPLSGSSV
jgi:hypothetical protein